MNVQYKYHNDCTSEYGAITMYIEIIDISTQRWEIFCTIMPVAMPIVYNQTFFQHLPYYSKHVRPFNKHFLINRVKATNSD